ncbi:hypothetical protein HMPREF9080_00206 [Cardiobacterium valvarum F0432]|uniref:Uncharacterized protein n=1 Tax=Cardiobacterium valvarum F0432 TaxID=797473 RepID=G9ZBS9_9GAMM|nr:hypothetical protein HMPREF9080_00206 [Cardiobacterium valvarum F0432]
MRAFLTTYPAMPAYTLPYGTLHLDIDHADLPPDDLFALGARDNPRGCLPFRQQSAGQTHPGADRDPRPCTSPARRETARRSACPRAFHRHGGNSDRIGARRL